jgi:uncharacterized protein involved in outer membrane biogenesis
LSFTGQNVTKPYKWGLAVAALVLALAAIVPVLALLVDAGYFRGPLLAYVTNHYERPIRVDGALELQLWSSHPRIVARKVIIGNPSWVQAGEMVRIERVTLVFGGLKLGHAATLESIAMEGADLQLSRDAGGRANWQRFDPDSGEVGKGMPLIRELAVPDAHLRVDDELHHMHFDGTVSANGTAAAASRLHIEVQGRLNGRPVRLELSGAPLGGVSHDTRYAFEFTEQSSGSRLDLHGSLPQPFDFNVLNGTFEAQGADLKDLYFLTGLSLVHSGAFRLTGSFERRGIRTNFDQLKLTTGESDIAGSLSSYPQGGVTGRPMLEGTVTAGVLHLADFGARAAQLEAEGPRRVFSDGALNAEGLRRRDAHLRFAAQRVDVGRTALQALSGELNIDHGVVTVPALRAELLQGKVQARLKLDANGPVPAAEVSMRFMDLQLAALAHDQQEPPLEGLMQVSVDLTGTGASLHQVAASADGSVAATLPHGKIRLSLAELAGVELRSLGLILARSKRDTDVRCAVATFKTHDGMLTAQSIVIDTEPVLIRGEGVIHLDTETLDLALRGEPKDLRLLRVDAPLLIRGPLRRPTFAIQTHDSSLKLLDRGPGKDVDCAALLSQAR